MVDQVPDSRDVAGLKFDGGRFDKPGFPLTASNTLAKYHSLVLEAARILWKRENPGRKLPDNFADSIHLGLLDIKEGSATPVIADKTSGEGLLDARTSQAIDFVNNTVFAVMEHAFGPPEEDALLLRGEILAFNKTFKSDERTFFRQGTDRAFRVDEAARQRIRDVLLQEPKEVRGVVLGELYRIGRDGKMDVRDPNGLVVQARFDFASQFNDLHALINSTEEGGWVWIDGDLAIDPAPKPKVSIGKIHNFGDFGVGSPEVVRRLSELSIQRLFNFGDSIPVDVLTLCFSLAGAEGPIGKSAHPAIFLGADSDEPEAGGVRIEWLLEDAHLSVDITDDLALGFGYFRVRDSVHRFGDEIENVTEMRRLLNEALA